ncbi:hypothetical protein JFT86_22280 [Pseudomonas sp. TH06]|uniref:hypothetical protein n=2 Tax=unclassified Pseudomonas TaxID=196821 RepID=UPI00191346EA|nr:hypothetical protein [Pseudomonas sp. TH06]MBK5529667.1 hypothetical protein [Pseudomonas sp. TH06]
MISTDFHQLVELFIEGAGNLQPGIFGLNGFSESDFINADFELIGDPIGFHSFEKAYEVPYFRRKITVVFKQYFFASESLGGGLGIAGGVRLTSLLRKQPFATSTGQVDTNRMEFFFFEDKSDGALIFDEKIVIRFDQWSKRNSYVVSTVECDFDNAQFNDIAKKAVRETFEPSTYDSMIRDAKQRGCSRAFNRLLAKL